MQSRLKSSLLHYIILSSMAMLLLLNIKFRKVAGSKLKCFYNLTFSHHLKNILFYLFYTRREGGREGEKHQCVRYMDWLPLTHLQSGTWPSTQACALTGDQSYDFANQPLNPLSRTSQGLTPFFTEDNCVVFTSVFYIQCSLSTGCNI